MDAVRVAGAAPDAEYALELEVGMIRNRSDVSPPPLVIGPFGREILTDPFSLPEDVLTPIERVAGRDQFHSAALRLLNDVYNTAGDPGLGSGFVIED